METLFRRQTIVKLPSANTEMAKGLQYQLSSSAGVSIEAPVYYLQHPSCTRRAKNTMSTSH